MRFILALGALCVASAQTIVIRNVTVIDADGPRPNSTVVIRDGRIVSEGRGGGVSGGTVVDGRSRYLIPGLWDMHVHLWETDSMSRLYVAAGVLGVRDMGSDIARTLRLRSEITAGRTHGPRIYTSGSVIDGAASRMKQAPVLKVENPQQARDAVDAVEKSSADFIKILSGLTADEYQSVAQRARVIRMPLAGHLPDSVTALDAVDARQKSIEHLFGIDIACSPLEPTLRRQREEAMAKRDRAALRAVQERVYSTFSAGAANDLFHRMARFGVYQTPTLTMLKRMWLIDMERGAKARELKYVPAAIRSGWGDPPKDAEGATPNRRAELQKDYAFAGTLVKFMKGSGVSVLAGTDTGDPWVVPGFALHDELEAMVAAGLTPQEALNSATVEPARYFGIDDRLGSIRRGKAADLVLLEADPTAAISNTRKIAAVIQNGHLLSRKCLDGLLEGNSGTCPSVSLNLKPAPSSAKRPATSRRRASRTR